MGKRGEQGVLLLEISKPCLALLAAAVVVYRRLKGSRLSRIKGKDLSKSHV